LNHLPEEKMSIVIKNEEEIAKMRIVGRLAADVLDMITPHVVVGVTTNELNDICHDYIVNVQQATSAPLDYRGFPKSICTSINHQVCHGIPSDKKLKSGDIINIDITVLKDGFHGDTSMMFCVGKVAPHAQRLCDIARESLFLGIAEIKAGATLGNIGHAIQKHAEKHRYSVVQDYCGHGIGRDFHEEPQVLHYGVAGEGIALEAGMIITVEPMINQGKHDTKLLGDKWTVVTKDHSLSAQYEHTILVTEEGYEILTLRAEERTE
jgi:methionyl aminopeptidase